MKTAVVRFLSLDFIAIPQLHGGDRACEGCALLDEDNGFDCNSVKGITCGPDKSIYVLNEESLARRVANKLTNKD